jgi:hypothetical protein
MVQGYSAKQCYDNIPDTRAVSRRCHTSNYTNYPAKTSANARWVQHETVIIDSTLPYLRTWSSLYCSMCTSSSIFSAMSSSCLTVSSWPLCAQQQEGLHMEICVDYRDKAQLR